MMNVSITVLSDVQNLPGGLCPGRMMIKATVMMVETLIVQMQLRLALESLE